MTGSQAHRRLPAHPVLSGRPPPSRPLPASLQPPQPPVPVASGLCLCQLVVWNILPPLPLPMPLSTTVGGESSEILPERCPVLQLSGACAEPARRHWGGGTGARKLTLSVCSRVLADTGLHVQSQNSPCWLLGLSPLCGGQREAQRGYIPSRYRVSGDSNRLGWLQAELLDPLNPAFVLPCQPPQGHCFPGNRLLPSSGVGRGCFLI